MIEKILTFIWKNLASVFLTLCSAYALSFNLAEKLQKLPFINISPENAVKVDQWTFWILLGLLLIANFKVWRAKNYLEAQNQLYKQIFSAEYSTYPVMSQPRNSILNLPVLAQKYQQLQQRAIFTK